MYKLSTSAVFHTDTDPNDNMNQSTEGEWPPFRKVCGHNDNLQKIQRNCQCTFKMFLVSEEQRTSVVCIIFLPFIVQVGCFDPYSDDPRLGIQKIHLCKYSGYLTVAGTAGQVRGEKAFTISSVMRFMDII